MKKKFNDSAFGWDGLTTLVFSNIILLLTCGLFFLWLFSKTLHIAIKTKNSPDLSKTNPNPIRAILIAGLCLNNNQPNSEYYSRLNRVVTLLTPKNNTPKIIILGGVTGANTISEAQAGADYLIRQGIKNEQIILEDQSRHTLENLQNARSILEKLLADNSLDARSNLSENGQTGKISTPGVVVISSRYHLYRIQTLAKGLHMALHSIASEKSFYFSLKMMMRLLKEAYFLHWYWSGKLWVFITINKKSQARIS